MTLKTEVMMLKIQLCITGNKIAFENIFKNFILIVIIFHNITVIFIKLMQPL